MTTGADHVAAHQRLILLRELARLSGYSANDSYLQGVLRGMGLPAARDTVRDHLAWLAEHGLVGLELPAGDDGPLVSSLTPSGMDVASGVEVVEGVQRPSPTQAGAESMAASTRLAVERLRSRRG